MLKEQVSWFAAFLLAVLIVIIVVGSYYLIYDIVDTMCTNFLIHLHQSLGRGPLL